MSTMQQAERIKARVEEILGDLVDLVTLDGVGIKAQTRAAVVILAPRVTFPTFGERDTTFRLAAVAGPADRPIVAWRQLDAILDALEAGGLNLAEAEPGSFDLAGAGRLPAYEITLNPL